MNKFEHLKNSQYVVALAISDMCDMSEEMKDEFGEDGCDLFANWMMEWADDEMQTLAKEFAKSVIGSKIKELKGE